MTDPRRPILHARRRSAPQRNDRYRMRIMGAVVGSLLLITGVVHLPLSGAAGRVGWGPGSQASEPIRLHPAPPEEMSAQKQPGPMSAPVEGAPITGIAAKEPADRKQQKTHVTATAPSAGEPRASDRREQPSSAALAAVKAAGLQSERLL